ncbi:MAG TPA: hypothetical protein VEF03_04995 [Candidatus Binataceae bacterium]|nr:hypothetical protein [Candidatus Binataceae bacterium]
MLFGPRVVIAAANPRLNAQVSRSVVFIGEKVAVARAISPSGDRRSYLFCDECGRNLLSHVNLRQERYYRWDFLADFRLCTIVDKIARWFERPGATSAV